MQAHGTRHDQVFDIVRQVVTGRGLDSIHAFVRIFEDQIIVARLDHIDVIAKATPHLVKVVTAIQRVVALPAIE